MGILSVRNLNKRFGGLQALNDVNLEVEEGTVHALVDKRLRELAEEMKKYEAGSSE